jgi:hypothetical protein
MEVSLNKTNESFQKKLITQQTDRINVDYHQFGDSKILSRENTQYADNFL